jgi:hypothetical protein
MNALLAQLIFARGNGVGEWMNILVIVIMAAVYGLGTIIKTKRKKSQEQGEQELGRKPARKPATGGRGVLEQFFNELRNLAEPAQDRESRPTAQPAQPARQKIARPQHAVRKYAAEAKQAGRVQPGTVQPGFEELPESTTKTVEELVGKRKGMAAEVPESKYISEVLADFTDPEDLRMAILHYEILGRPLSLRDPSGQIIGLKL